MNAKNYFHYINAFNVCIAVAVFFLSACSHSYCVPSEAEKNIYETAIDKSSRANLNLPLLPEKKDRYWIVLKNERNHVSFFDLNNRNFVYTFTFKILKNGELELTSERVFFDSDKYFPHTPERMTRSDYITYEYSYADKRLNYLYYNTSLWSPSIAHQSVSSEISMEESIKVIEDWNKLTPKIDSSKWVNYNYSAGTALKSRDIIGLQKSIKATNRIEQGLPGIIPFEDGEWNAFSRNGIRAGMLCDGQSNNKIFIFYFEVKGKDYILLKEETYLYKNEFAKWFNNEIKSNEYIRLIYSYKDSKFESIDFYRDDLDVNGNLKSVTRKLTLPELKDLIAEWHNNNTH